MKSHAPLQELRNGPAGHRLELGDDGIQDGKQNLAVADGAAVDFALDDFCKGEQQLAGAHLHTQRQCRVLTSDE